MTENEKEKILIELKVSLASITEQNKAMQETIKTLCSNYVTKEHCQVNRKNTLLRAILYFGGGSGVGSLGTIGAMQLANYLN